MTDHPSNLIACQVPGAPALSERVSRRPSSDPQAVAKLPSLRPRLARPRRRRLPVGQPPRRAADYQHPVPSTARAHDEEGRSPAQIQVRHIPPARRRAGPPLSVSTNWYLAWSQSVTQSKARAPGLAPLVYSVGHGYHHDGSRPETRTKKPSQVSHLHHAPPRPCLRAI